MQERQSRWKCKRSCLHGLVSPKVPQDSQSRAEMGMSPSHLRHRERRCLLPDTGTAAGNQSTSTPGMTPLPGLTTLASSPFFVIVFSVFLHFPPSYPLFNLFSQFLLLLSACTCVFSASNFCHISCLNFSCSISFPMLMSSVCFTLGKHFSFHFQGLFPFELCVSMYIHTYRYIHIYIHKS